MKTINEQMLCDLRQTVANSMSPKRFYHTVCVEEAVAALCDLFCPEHTDRMRAAALLHDLTKERSGEEQVALCQQYGLPITDADRLSPKTFHARTAAAKIAHEFPAFADEMIVNAVRWHTTGHAGMTLTEKLLYLADYIDASRTFPACVTLREHFWNADPVHMTYDARLALLRETMILSYDMTIKDLLDEGLPVAADTVLARNELLIERGRH